MKIIFPKKENHIPKWYIIDASTKTLGYLCTKIVNLLVGKTTSFYNPSINQGNFVIIINFNKLYISKTKLLTKKYYISSNRPGNLKSINLFNLKKKNPSIILKQAISKMLPKNKISNNFFKRLFIYL
jgi:large subunit ribosomal protein L13